MEHLTHHEKRRVKQRLQDIEILKASGKELRVGANERHMHGVQS